MKVLPQWLAERGATVIIAAGMGQRAQGLFTEQGIKEVVGASLVARGPEPVWFPVVTSSDPGRRSCASATHGQASELRCCTPSTSFCPVLIAN
jgi:hypothetical protein